jgi:hypothetical protein
VNATAAASTILNQEVVSLVARIMPTAPGICPIVVSSPPVFCSGAVADVVVRLLERLPGNGCTVAPITFARGHLTKAVVFIHPKASIGQIHAHPLVGIVIAIIEIHGRGSG